MTFTISEMLTLMISQVWERNYLLENQEEPVARINAALNGGPAEFPNYHEERIYHCCKRKVDTDAREAANRAKYEGVTPHVADKIEIGAILVSSWGYDQTNVDFYAVVSMTPKMCKLLPVKGAYNENGFMSGKTVATKEIDYSSEVLTKKIGDRGISISSFQYAGLWDGREMYESHYA